MQEYMKLLGLSVRDVVTGFTGVVSSVSFDLYGCVQTIVTPPIDEKGALGDGRWFDAKRLEIVNASPVMAVPSFSTT
jgi:hypothetical protein